MLSDPVSSMISLTVMARTSSGQESPMNSMASGILLPFGPKERKAGPTGAPAHSQHHLPNYSAVQARQSA